MSAIDHNLHHLCVCVCVCTKPHISNQKLKSQMMIALIFCSLTSHLNDNNFISAQVYALVILLSSLNIELGLRLV